MKKTVLFFMIILFVVSSTINVTASDTDAKLHSVLDYAVEYNGNYYCLISRSECTWYQAKMYCEGIGGHLATITSKEEDNFCYKLWEASGRLFCWLGASDTNLEGVWKWITGEEWKYSNWADDEPNGGTLENCLSYYKASYSKGRWNDYSGKSNGSFICEWEKEDIEYIKKTYGVVTSSGLIYNDAFYFNGNVYKVFEYGMSFAEAKNYCQELGGHLASITSLEEDKAVYYYIMKMGNPECVLGGNDVTAEGLWEWSNGEDFSYFNWNKGEPNDSAGEDHLQYSNLGTWNDTSWKHCFLCEWDNCCILYDGTITEHSFGNPQIIKEATCTKDGKLKQTCEGCGTEKYEEIKKPHNMNEWKTTLAPTCCEAGEEKRRCNNCKYEEIKSISSLNHKWSELVVVSGNKLIPPIVREKTCSLCNEVKTYEDWSNIWITFLTCISVIGVIIGIINYAMAFKKR